MRRVESHAAQVLLLWLLVAGCSAEPLRQGHFICEDDGQCPSGWFCEGDGYCYSHGMTDSAPDGTGSDTVEPDTDSDTSDDSESDEDSCGNQSYRQCAADGNVHWFNSCHEQGGTADDCHDTRGTCIDLSQTEAACACVDNWDIATRCTSCKDFWTGPNCEVCPEHGDASQDCTACLPGWAGSGCHTCVRYVRHDSTGSGLDGKSWDRAFKTVQSGITAAASAVSADASVDDCEVWVAAGIYYIYSASKDDTVLLAPHTHLYGGFAGVEKQKTQRDFAINKTVLNGCDTDLCANRVEHVIWGANASTIDGFFITEGDGKGQPGGGMYNVGVSPLVQSCVFVRNASDGKGGAVYNQNASPRFVSCVFADNVASDGGAVYSAVSGAPEFKDCVFSGNTSSSGGALHNLTNINAVIENTIFAGNFASSIGGAIYSKTDASIEVRSTLFVGNGAKEAGVIYGEAGGNHTLTNCTLTGNYLTAADSGMIHSKGDITNVTVTNTILWNTSFNEIYQEGNGVATVTYSNVEGDHLGQGNIEVNPGYVGDVLYSDNWSKVTYQAAEYRTAFQDNSASWASGELAGLIVRPSNGKNLRLWIQDNTEDTIYVWGDMRSFGAAEGFYAVYDLRLGEESECIDVGNGDVAPALDLDGNPRVDAPGSEQVGTGTPNYTDIGAYEFQP